MYVCACEVCYVKSNRADLWGNPLPAWLKVIITRTHTHQTHEGEISHHTISMAITKTSVSAAWRKELQGVCERMSVCWDWTGAIFPLVLTGIVLGLDGWVSGFGLVQAVSYVFACLHILALVFVCPPSVFLPAQAYPPLHPYTFSYHSWHYVHDSVWLSLCFHLALRFFLQSALKCLYVC